MTVSQLDVHVGDVTRAALLATQTALHSAITTPTGPVAALADGATASPIDGAAASIKASVTALLTAVNAADADAATRQSTAISEGLVAIVETDYDGAQRMNEAAGAIPDYKAWTI